MRCVAAASFVTFAAMNVAGCSTAITRRVLAVILSTSGSAEWAPDATSPLRPIDRAATVGSGSIVRTRSGELEVAVVPGALMRISAQTELQVEELAVTKDGNDTEDRLRDRLARIRLNRGSIVVLLDSPARFTIETSQVAMKVPPGSLLRLTSKDGNTRLTCVRGKIQLKDQAALASIDAGYVHMWPSSQPPQPAADDADAQADITEALQSETQLREAAARDSGNTRPR